MTEAAEQFQHEAVRPVSAYSMLKPGSSQVSVGLRNLSCKSVANQKQ